jgi:hypothetical protein
VPGPGIVVRERCQGGSSSVRKAGALPPAEIDAALLEIVDTNFGAGRDDLIVAASRAFGFASTSAQLREVLQQRITELEKGGIFSTKGELIVRATA